MAQLKLPPKWQKFLANTQNKIYAGVMVLFLVVFIVAFLLPIGDDTNAAEKESADGFFENLFAGKEEDPQSYMEEQENHSGLLSNIMDIFASGVQETEEVTFGIDVAKYQGTIDWEKVAQSGLDFAMVRVGYRGMVSGEISEDPTAKYNMQEAQKHGIKLGAYFFSTAVTAEEAAEEANWVADYISQYQITYPIAYDCERYNETDSRQYGMTKGQRTDIALAFLRTIEERGYEGMFYANRNEMQDDTLWEVSRVDPEYKVWVAQYPEFPYPATPASSYTGVHHMWQYSRNGVVPGIEEPVDINIAYFGYDGTGKAKDDTPAETVDPAVEAMMTFKDADEYVTAKKKTNLRTIPSQDQNSEVFYQLQNGEAARRVGISDSGWSKLIYEGKTCYAVSSYLTTDFDYTPPTEPIGGIKTVFTAVEEEVTAKDQVNLRTLPSVTHADSKVVATLKSGDVVMRVGISDNGWSKLSYNGETFYAVTNYLTTDLTAKPQSTTGDGVIDTVFTDCNEKVTAKDVVNLRSMPSVTDAGATVVAQLKHGEIVIRTGINTDVGWSRIEYNGQTLYCVSSYLELTE